MPTEKFDKSKREKLNILILADYSEGNRAAIHFAMRYLYRPGSLFHFIQTWHKPNFGSSMVRDLTPMLEGIANSELENLRLHLKDCYSMPDDQIRLISFEGDLSSFFKSDTYQSQDWTLVLGSHDYENLFAHKYRMNELINQVSQDLFVLAGFANDNTISEIFMLADTDQTATSNLSLLKKIAISEKPDIHVCLSQRFDSSEARRNRALPLIEACKGAKINFSMIENGEGQKELKEFSRSKGNKLILFEKNSQRRFQNGMRSCLDVWFLKSKGIRI
ncbi:hypothetical protein EO244_05580 [Ancylomarina salipaludis]|uniref:Universal stress protein n=1 Tax=Ancylomarina salipaludis TaxID=2501299 RepID=A0A4Q1JMH7_9BACT|nr:hypothetical protein [Ancylomarina salipaludis]RXQ95779.1 hypothetical protein EO244_05580 [Ancylomarina salipaludis]